MIRPAAFFFNEETAENNYYQDPTKAVPKGTSQERALAEFNAFVDLLRSKGIDVITFDDTVENNTPDSIFPNNWVSFHSNGRIFLYPMNAVSRRRERRTEILDLLRSNGFNIESITDYSTAESDNTFLEGTGSMIFDREHNIAYAARSQRTDESLFRAWCDDARFTPVVFSSFQTVGDQRLPIYHTNVMMCVADQYAVICLDTIDNPEERAAVVASLQSTGKTIVEISEAQVNQFAGNMLQVQNQSGTRFLVMSESAYQSLTVDQRRTLESFNELIHADLPTIETCGGGSARCMMAEVFLPKA